ncbi:MAG TPA: hypothetical protein VHF26_02005, partial [Trebonia sp.]|nr:hypothetical protein [Trebonia sp.]
MADGLTLPRAVWRDGTLADVRTGSETRSFRVRGRRKAAFLVSGTEALFLPAWHPRRPCRLGRRQRASPHVGRQPRPAPDHPAGRRVRRRTRR